METKTKIQNKLYKRLGGTYKEITNFWNWTWVLTYWRYSKFTANKFDVSRIDGNEDLRSLWNSDEKFDNDPCSLQSPPLAVCGLYDDRWNKNRNSQCQNTLQLVQFFTFRCLYANHLLPAAPVITFNRPFQKPPIQGFSAIPIGQKIVAKCRKDARIRAKS